MRMLRVLISSWRVRSVNASVPYASALLSMFWIWNLFKFGTFTLMISIRVRTDVDAQGTQQFLACVLSEHISSWCVCSACFEGTFQISYMHLIHALVHNENAQYTLQFLMRMLSLRIRSWCICSGCASVPDAYAHCIYQFLTSMLRLQNEHLKNGKTDAHAEHARKERMRTLRVRISSWRLWSGCASDPEVNHTINLSY